MYNEKSGIKNVSQHYVLIGDKLRKILFSAAILQILNFIYFAMRFIDLKMEAASTSDM